MRHVRNSRKNNNAHTTIIESGKSLVELLERLESVTKYALGKIVPGPKRNDHPPKITNIRGGLEVTIFGCQAKQAIYVYGADLLAIRRAVEEHFQT